MQYPMNIIHGNQHFIIPETKIKCSITFKSTSYADHSICIHLESVTGAQSD